MITLPSFPQLTNPKWQVIVAFSNSSVAVWTGAYSVKDPFVRSDEVHWGRQSFLTILRLNRPFLFLICFSDFMYSSDATVLMILQSAVQ